MLGTLIRRQTLFAHSAIAHPSLAFFLGALEQGLSLESFFMRF